MEPEAPPRFAVVVVGVVAGALLLPAACARPLGSVFDSEPPPIDWVTETCVEMGGLQPHAPWPMFQRCPSHAGVSPHLGPSVATVRWSEPCNTTLEGFVVAAGGTIFGCTDEPTTVGARDSVDGARTWTAVPPSGGALYSGFPAIGADGTFYVATTQGLTAYSISGSLRWFFSHDDQTLSGAIVIDRDELVYVNQSHNRLLVVTPEGALHRTYDDHNLGDEGLNMLSAYAGLTPDGAVILSGTGHTEDSWGGSLVLIEPGGYDRLLHFEPEGLLGIPVLDGAGTVFILARDQDESQGGELLAVSSTGEVLWRTEGVTTDEIAPAIGPDGTVYVASGGGESEDSVRAYSPEGQQLWEHTLPALPTAHPVVDGAGTVYLGLANYVVSVGRAGQRRWTLELDTQVPEALALGDDHTLYVQTDTQLLAIGE
ncbi:MAG: PQQ-binding-like beta-propeller repeat protein [bacterium]